MPVTPTGVEKSLDRAITDLLVELSRGNREAENRLVPLIYQDLRRVAAGYMRRERGNHTLEPTAVVNEVWLRLGDQAAISWQNRGHFFAVASRIMRQILVDHARRRRAGKRGGAQQPVTLEDNHAEHGPILIDVLALNQALDRLEEFDERACRIVELHFFGGLSFEEMEPVLGISKRTIKRDWTMARGWLREELAEKQ